MRHMDVGVFLAMEPHERTAQQDYAEVIDLAQQCEELGYSSLWLASRHFSPDYAALPSPLVLLAAVAARTTKINLGTCVVSLPLENVERIAEDFATLDAISAGRGRLGVGSGDDPPSFKALGVDFDARAGMLSKLLPHLLEVLDGADLDGVTLYPEVSAGASKVALGAQSARGAAWAASQGVGLLQGRSEPNSLDPTVSQVRAAEAYREGNPNGRVATARNAWVGTLEDAELMEGLERYDRAMKARGRAGLPEDRKQALMKMNMIAGSPESLAKQLRAMVSDIKPDELLITPDPGGLEATDRMKRLTQLAEAFQLS